MCVNVQESAILQLGARAAALGDSGIGMRMAHHFAGAALAACALAFASAGAAHAACREDRTAQADGSIRAIAETQATVRWRLAVRKEFGGEFAHWSRARRKTLWCHKPQPGNTWHCIARATPCNGKAAD